MAWAALVAAFLAGLAWLGRLEAGGPPHADLFLEGGQPATLHLPGPGDVFARTTVPPGEALPPAVLLVHGYAEHSGRYDALGAWFAARDWAVHAYDHRGHGRSEGTRCHVDRFDELLDDLDIMLGLVREEHPDVPVVLVGHSMGGLVVTTFLCERSPAVRAAATSGALLALSDEVPAWRVGLARALRRVTPRLSLELSLIHI